MRRLSMFVVALVLVCGNAIAAQQPDPAARIVASRSQLRVSASELSGAGAEMLSAATGKSQYVLLGEDHGTREIPLFASALFRSLVPHGFHTTVLEVGPEVAPHLQRWAASPSGASELASFETNHLGTVAFFTWRDEFAFLREASKGTKGALRVWGVDQELEGASQFLMESILAQHPGRGSQTLVHRLLVENAADNAKAVQTGNPAAMFMMAASDASLGAFTKTVSSDGNARARYLAGTLTASAKIYRNCCNAHASESNRARAHLMKTNFSRYQAEAPGAKLFFKFGEEHLYRGFNVVRNNDLGNYVSEIADASGSNVTSILALGVGGEQIAFAGIGKWRHAQYSLLDDDHARFHYLKPFIDNMYPSDWTLYDLRPLRTHFDLTGIADKDYERLVFGYDFLLLIPKTTADDPLTRGLF